MPFIAYDVSLELARHLREPVAALARRNPSLADQLQRAAQSIPLNIAEGNGRAGRDRLHAFRIAAGSAREVTAALQVAELWGQLDAGSLQPALASCDRLLGLLWGLTH